MRVCSVMPYNNTQSKESFQEKERGVINRKGDKDHGTEKDKDSRRYAI